MANVELESVPADQVGNVVKSFITDDDATHVEADANGDGTFTVTATIPD